MNQYFGKMSLVAVLTGVGAATSCLALALGELVSPVHPIQQTGAVALRVVALYCALLGPAVAPLRAPVEAVPGVGYATQRKLTEHGVRVCGDICGMNLGLLHKQFGQVHGGFLWNLAHGRDARQLMKRGAAKSISHQSTLQRTTTDKDYVESLLMYIAERCLWRLRTAQMRTRSFSIYMRFADQRYGQRVTHLKNGTQSEHVILPLISQMTREIWMLNPKPRVTFVGVHLSDFQPATPQGELFFDDTEKKERLSRAMGSLREKFGSPVITSARTFGLHHSYRLSQAGLSFSVATVEEKEAAEMAKREAEEYMAMDLVM